MVQGLDLPMVSDQLCELGGDGLLDSQAGHRVDGGDRRLAGFAVGTAALDLKGLVGAGDEQVVDAGDLDPVDLGAAVAGAAGASLERDVLPGQGLQLLAQLLPVAWRSRCSGPGDRGGSRRARACCAAASLVTTLPARSSTLSSSGWKRLVPPTSSWASTSPVVCSRPRAGGSSAPVLRRAAQGLAVHGQAARPGSSRLAIGESSADCLIQGIPVDAREKSANRRCCSRRDAVGSTCRSLVDQAFDFASSTWRSSFSTVFQL